MDGETGWWTTSGNIGLPPLARAMGVGRQQHYGGVNVFHVCLSFGVVVSTHSLDPCLWGESDHHHFGPPASISLHLTSSSITPSGPVHKSRGDSVVRMWVQLKRWSVSCVWVLQRGHSGDGCDLKLTTEQD